MHAWSTSDKSRAGMGAMVAFVIWVVTIALIYALMLGQGQSGALSGVVRVTAVRQVVLAAQSALAEASYVLRHPADGGSTVLNGVHKGATSGEAHDPAATRELYKDEIGRGRLTVDTVRYEVALKSAKSSDPWHIDLTARATCTFAGHKVTRQVRRRVMGWVNEIKGIEGPQKGKVVIATMSIRGESLFEVIEP